MASEHGVVRFEVPGEELFEGARHAAMQKLASRRQELGVHDLANPVVGEVKAFPGATEYPPPHQLFDTVSSFAVCELGSPLEEAELELAPDHRRDGCELVALGARSLQAAGNDFADALGQGQGRGESPSPVAAFLECPHALNHDER